MVEELPVGYYLDNFNTVLDFVASQYADLLSPEETDWHHTFKPLPLDSQRLYVRLCSRKGPLFRTDKLNYDEIDIEQGLAGLFSAGLADDAPEASLDDLVALLTRQELASWARQTAPGLRKSAPRDELVSALLATATPAALRAHLDFTIVQPLGLDILGIYKLLFFGNARQDFTEFVLRDLGISPYEPYEIHPEDRYFDDRAVLESTLVTWGLGDIASVAIEEDDVETMQQVAQLLPDCPQASQRRRAGRIRNRMARQLERLGMLDEALAMYRQTDAAPSRERRARILHKQGDIDGAVALCREIVEDPEDEAEFEFGHSFARRILKAAKRASDGFLAVGGNTFTVREIVVEQTPGRRVEMLACDWFLARGDDARYVENGLFPGLFGLAFWDVIFHPVKGAFFNPFQRGPADIFTPDFRDNRHSLIEQRFAELEDKTRFVQRVLATLEAKRPTANHFVTWHLLDEDLLAMALDRIPVPQILGIFRRLLRDLRRNCSGFPDLVVFPANGGYRLAEIKGPGDALQDNQKRWLRYFDANNIPAEVVNVAWA